MNKEELKQLKVGDKVRYTGENDILIINDEYVIDGIDTDDIEALISLRTHYGTRALVTLNEVETIDKCQDGNACEHRFEALPNRDDIIVCTKCGKVIELPEKRSIAVNVEWDKEELAQTINDIMNDLNETPIQEMTIEEEIRLHPERFEAYRDGQWDTCFGYNDDIEVLNSIWNQGANDDKVFYIRNGNYKEIIRRKVTED